MDAAAWESENTIAAGILNLECAFACGAGIAGAGEDPIKSERARVRHFVEGKMFFECLEFLGSR